MTEVTGAETTSAVSLIEKEKMEGNVF